MPGRHHFMKYWQCSTSFISSDDSVDYKVQTEAKTCNSSMKGILFSFVVIINWSTIWISTKKKETCLFSPSLIITLRIVSCHQDGILVLHECFSLNLIMRHMAVSVPLICLVVLGTALNWKFIVFLLAATELLVCKEVYCSRCNYWSICKLTLTQTA